MSAVDAPLGEIRPIGDVSQDFDELRAINLLQPRATTSPTQGRGVVFLAEGMRYQYIFSKHSRIVTCEGEPVIGSAGWPDRKKYPVWFLNRTTELPDSVFLETQGAWMPRSSEPSSYDEWPGERRVASRTAKQSRVQRRDGVVMAKLFRDFAYSLRGEWEFRI